MSQFGYPKYGKSQRQGKSGESFVDNFVHHKLGWIYRPTHQESDFGIDGYIDIVTNGNVTGQTIGIQIKCGDSYFNKKTGGVIRYEGENKHLNYYLNCPFSIILIVLNGECDQGKWVEFNANITSPSKSGWSIEIPNKNSLAVSVKNNWELIAGSVFDYSEQIALSWKENKELDESDFGVYFIQKDEILACDFSIIKDVIGRLARNRDSLLKKRGTLEVLIEGYNEDPREVYEIPEIRHWYSESIKAGIPWFYFLGEMLNRMGFTVLLSSCCDIEVKSNKFNDTKIEYSNVEQLTEWLENNFDNLNKFIDDNEIPEKINKEMSKRVTDFIRETIKFEKE